MDYLIIGEDGYVYAIKDGIWKISPQGEMSEVLNSTQFPAGPGRLLCIDRQANIYFVNLVKSIPEIYRRTPDGKVSLLASGGGVQQQTQAIFGHINSAAWAPDGSLYVRDDQTIRRIAADGTVSTLLHSEDAAMAEGGEDRLVRTMGMAVDIAGNVYAAFCDAGDGCGASVPIEVTTRAVRTAGKEQDDKQQDPMAAMIPNTFTQRGVLMADSRPGSSLMPSPVSPSESG